MTISVLHIGKTGGTALNTILKEADKDKYLEFHGHRTYLSELWNEFPERDVIFGVRDPISRYVSAFNSRLRQGLPRHHSPWTRKEQIIFSKFQTPNLLAEALSSSNLEEKEAAEFAMRGIKHVNKKLTVFLGSVENLRNNESKIKFVYLVETMNSDFEIIKNILGIAADVTLPTDPVVAHKTPDGMSVELSENAKRNLSSWYCEDIEIYEYCKDLRQRLVSKFSVTC